MGPQSYTSLNEPNEMVATQYQQAIIDSLLESIPTNVIPDTLQIVPVFDLQSNRYQLLCQGWTSGEKRVFHPVIHIEIINGKVWIQHNQTDVDIGEELSNRGIPKSQMVLGLHPPSIRELNPIYDPGADELDNGAIKSAIY
ncbi:XisI protein [Calothrix sp. NIES-4071]|nr:XisI protein [Calothrix sp. NIES-4071]BAZ60986.1 XisI protein [Calothrix sp. NIES-4105]